MAKRKMAELIWRKIFSGGGGGQGEARKKSRLDMLWNRWKKEEKRIYLRAILVLLASLGVERRWRFPKV